MIKLINIKILDNVFILYFISKKNLYIDRFIFNSKEKGKNIFKFFINLSKRGYFFYSPKKFAFLINEKKVKKIEDLIFVIKSLINLFLIKEKIIFIHASSIKIKNKSYLFIGPSGIGKTTLLRKLSKWREVKVLSDDTAVVHIKNKKAFITSSPFDKKKNIKIVHDKQIELSKIFLLNKSEKNIIKKIPLNKRVIKLYQNLIVYEYLKKTKDIYRLKDQIKLQKKIFTLLEFIKKKQFYQLSLRKDINLNDLKKFLILPRNSIS